MAQVDLVCGRRTVPVSLDDDAQVVEQGVGLPVEPVRDLEATVRQALREPLDRPPLADLVRPGSRVTVAFDDPTVPCYVPVWEVGLNAIIDELVSGGVAEENITLIAANGLHRQFTHDELAKTIGPDLVDRFSNRLSCHDAEDAANMIFLGETGRGHGVDLNRRAVETDLCVYLNTVCWRAFNGGWKSICVGLSTYSSIRHHHTPDAMSMSIAKNAMHEILDEMGALCERRLGPEHFFKVETVLANPLEVGGMWAGSVGAARSAVLDVMREQTTARRDLVAEKVDIVCYGVPEWSPYATFAGMNPLLTLVSTGLGYLGGVIEGLGKPGCSVVLASPCPDRWDEVHHPSYREVWDRVLPQTRDPYQIRDRYQEEFAHRSEYIGAYRRRFGFHPVHGIMATYPLKRLHHAGQVFVAHAEAPELVEHLGFIPTATVDEAIEQARAIHGAHATVGIVQYPMAVNRQ